MGYYSWKNIIEIMNKEVLKWKKLK
jgi:hypothetical protein